MPAPLRVGVIGTGSMGSQHAELLAEQVPGAELVRVFDTDTARAAALAAGLPGVEVAPNPEDLLDAVDAAVIASADPTHEQYVLAALASGTPVLCEKPLAPDPDAVNRIDAAERSTGRRLVTVGFMRRFDRGYRELRAAMREPEFGRPLLVHCVHRNRAALGPLSARAVLTSSAEHEFDIVRWLLGHDIVEVTVHAGRPTSIRADQHDPLLVVARTEQDVLIDIELFINATYGYEVRCEIVGERRSAALDARPPVLLRSDGSAGRAVPGDWAPRFEDAYRRELTAWVRATAAGTVPDDAATTSDARHAALVSDAAIRAADTGLTQTVTAIDG